MSTKISSDLKHSFMDRFGDRVLFGATLAPYLAYRVGGPADCLVFPDNEGDLVWVRETAEKQRVPVTVIGNGTNLLVLDGGIRGIVISLSRAFREIEPVGVDQGKQLVRCGGGVEKATLLEWALEHDLTGLEFSSGVPGTIGGGIYMNAGTKYGCYGDILRELRLFDFEHGPRTLQREEAHFGYREQTAVKNSLVLSALFALAPGDGKAARVEVERIIDERAAKQPLDYPSCGSTFKNPVHELSAGRLIEQSGLKGLSVGAAEVSTKHANFILNKGGATAGDILALIEMVKQGVKKRFEVDLECEVIILGEPLAPR